MLNAPNPAENSSLGRGDAGWTLLGNAALTKEAAHTGQSGILIDNNGQNIIAFHKVEQEITLPESGGYELSFRMKLNIDPPKPANAAVRAGLLSKGGSRTWDLLLHSVRDPGGWMRLSKRIFIPEDWANQSTTLSFSLLYAQKSYLDDVFLTPADQLGPPAFHRPRANPDFEGGLSVTLNVPAGAASLTVKIGGVYCTGMFYADDVLLVRNP